MIRVVAARIDETKCSAWADHPLLRNGNNILGTQKCYDFDMKIARRIVAGGGALMACALITLISMMQTQWVKDHPIGSERLGFALLAGAIVCFIFWIATRDKPQAPPATDTNSGAKAGRDNLGTQIGGSVIGDSALEKILKASSSASQAPSKLYIQSAEYISTVDPSKFKVVTDCLRQLVEDDQLVFEIYSHNFCAGGQNYVPKDPDPYKKKKLSIVYSFNNGPLREVVQLEETTLRLPQAEVTAPPRSKQIGLQIEKPEFLFLISTRIAWQSALPGQINAQLGAIAWIHNPPAEEGETGNAIEGAVAALTYRGENRTLANVPTAFWLDHSAHEIDIKIGERRGIVLGVLPGGFTGQLWLAEENTRRTPFRMPRAGGVVNMSASRVSELILIRLREIDISIIANGITLKRFIVFVENMGEGKWNLALNKTH